MNVPSCWSTSSTKAGFVGPLHEANSSPTSQRQSDITDSVGEVPREIGKILISNQNQNCLYEIDLKSKLLQKKIKL